MAKAIILAAGFATRLSPLTDELPKPQVWVGDRPALAHVAQRLVASSIVEIVVNTHHLADAFSPERLARVPGRIAISSESEFLGTGVVVAKASAILGAGDVVVWNGDILADLDVAGARREGALVVGDLLACALDEDLRGHHSRRAGRMVRELLEQVLGRLHRSIASCSITSTFSQPP